MFGYLTLMEYYYTISDYISLSNSHQHSANVNVIANAKSKIIVSCWHFFGNVVFSATSKVQNYQNKTRENFLHPNNTCLLHVSRNFKDIFKYICFTLCVIVFTDLCCLPFFQYILDPISLKLIWSYNDLASIPRHYCSTSFRNSVSKMPISGQIFWVYEPLPFVKLIIL